MKLLITLILVALSSQIFFPQDIKYVRGKVVYKLENNVEEPQIGVTVFIEETGDRDKTDQDGMFKIFLNKEYKPGEGITFRIEKNNWAIRDPLFGKTYVPSVAKTELITLNILPQGSPLFFTNPQITRYIEYFVLKNNSEKEGSIVNYSNLSLEALLDTMAYSWGFKTSDIKSSIQKWVNNTLNDTSDLRGRGLAEYTQKNFNLAGELFIQSADKRIEKFRVVEVDLKNLTQERHSIIVEIIKDLRLAAESYFEVKKFDSSLAAYKNVIKYLEYSEDWEQLSSTLNKVGICYYNLSYESNAKKFFESLDSALIYFNKGMKLSEDRSLEKWRWKFKGNIAAVLLEKETNSENQNKLLTLLNIKTFLNEVEENRRNDTNSKDRFVSLNNLGVCYNKIYESSENISKALEYLDSSINICNKIIHDSTIKVIYPIEWAGINCILTGTLLEKNIVSQKLPSIFQCIAFEIMNRSKQKCNIPNWPFSRDSLSPLLFDESFNKIKESIMIFSRENKTSELISLNNALVYLRIQNILFFNQYFNNGYIDSTYDIINLNLNNASINRNRQNEIDSKLYKHLVEILIWLQEKQTSEKYVDLGIESLENCLTKDDLFELNIAYIKRVLILLYLYKYFSHPQIEKDYLILDTIEKLNSDIINIFERLSYFREYEDALELKKMINFIR